MKVQHLQNIFALRIHYFCCVTVFFNYRRYVNSISFPKADLFSWVEMQNRWILNILPHEVVIYLILPVHSFFMLMVFFRLDLIYLMLCIPHQTYFCHIFRVNGSGIIFVMENCSSIKRIFGVLYYDNHVCVTYYWKCNDFFYMFWHRKLVHHINTFMRNKW